MSKAIVVRRATEEDVQRLIELNYEFNGVCAKEEAVKDSLIHSNELVVIGFSEDRAVGFACAQYYKSFCYEHCHGEVTEMYVREEARRKGAASLFLSFIEEELRTIGVTSLNIITGLRNETAIKAYEKNSYLRKEHVVLNKKLET